MKPISISKAQAHRLMSASDGAIFTVTHLKKDGSERVTNGRLGVKKGQNGKGLKYVPAEHKLIPIYDMKIKDYRMVNLETVKILKIWGNEYKIED